MFEKLKEALHDAAERHRNRPFLEAAMAACAYVAMADGEVSFSERGRLDDILESLERLSVFDPHEGVDLFNEYKDALVEDAAAGHTKMADALFEIAEDSESALLVAKMTVAISTADGVFTPQERAAALDVMNLLGTGDIIPAHV